MDPNGLNNEAVLKDVVANMPLELRSAYMTGKRGITLVEQKD